MEKTQFEKIVCAAYWYDDGVEYPHQPTKTGFVIGGLRHHNIISTLHTNLTHQDTDHSGAVQPLHKVEMVTAGFLTTKNRFVDRCEAAEIAFKAGQTTKKTQLFSEDLY